MRTVIVSPLFTKLWPDYWSEDERAGGGKRGGVRVIYTLRLARGALVLLVMFAKSARDTIPAKGLREIAKEMGNVT